MKKMYSIILVTLMSVGWVQSQGLQAHFEPIFSLDHDAISGLFTEKIHEETVTDILEITIVIDIEIIEEHSFIPLIEYITPDFSRLSLEGTINTLDNDVFSEQNTLSESTVLLKKNDTFSNRLLAVTPNFWSTHNTNISEGFGVRLAF